VEIPCGMRIPAWRPPPDTDGLDYTTAARLRNAHRAAMAVRWRFKSAREADADQGRLPPNWHDWMGCPAPKEQNRDGYGHPWCTCDSWEDTRPSRRFGALKAPSRVTEALQLVVVKTIDYHIGFPILSSHASPAPPARDQEMVEPPSPTGRRRHRRQRRRSSQALLASESAWGAGKRYSLSALLRACSRSR